MARPRTAKTMKEMPDEEFDNIEQKISDEIALQEFLNEFGTDGAQLKIYRVPSSGPNGHARFVDTVIPDQVNEDILRERYGPGIYALRFIDSNGAFVKSKRVYIDPLKVADPSVAANPATSVSNQTQEHLQFMREQNAQMQNLLMGMITSMKGPDIGALLSGIAAMSQAARPPAPPAPPDVTSMLSTVVSAFTALRNASASKEDELERLSKMFSVFKEIAPNSGGSNAEDNVWTVVKEVGEKVLTALASPRLPGGAEGTTSNDPGRVSLSIPGHASVDAVAQEQPAVTQSTSKTRDQIMQDWLRAQLAYLKQKANAGKDVESWIDYIFDNTEEPGCAAILEAIERGATYEHLLQFDPEIGQNPALSLWFKKFYDGVYQEIIAGRVDANVDTSGSSGNAPDSGSDAGPRQEGREQN